MASSVSGQDELNPALGLATRAGKIDLYCLLETTRKPYNKSFIDQACSVKMTRHWPRSFFFCEYMDVDSVSVHKHAKKELGQYPAILTSHLVNNPYICIWKYLKFNKNLYSFVENRLAEAACMEILRLNFYNGKLPLATILKLSLKCNVLFM